jgi:hypothetical protein
MPDCTNCDPILPSHPTRHPLTVHDPSFNELPNASKNMSTTEGELKGWCPTRSVPFGCIIVIIVVKVDLLEGRVNSASPSCGWPSSRVCLLFPIVVIVIIIYGCP